MRRSSTERSRLVVRVTVRLSNGDMVTVSGKDMYRGTVESLAEILRHYGRSQAGQVVFDEELYNHHLQRMIEVMELEVSLAGEGSAEARADGLLDAPRVNVWDYLERDDSGMVYASYRMIRKLARQLRLTHLSILASALGGIQEAILEELESGESVKMRSYYDGIFVRTDPECVVNLSRLEEVVSRSDFRELYLSIRNVGTKRHEALQELLLRLRKLGVFDSP